MHHVLRGIILSCLVVLPAVCVFGGLERAYLARAAPEALSSNARKGRASFVFLALCIRLAIRPMLYLLATVRSTYLALGAVLRGPHPVTWIDEPISVHVAQFVTELRQAREHAGLWQRR